MISRSPAYGITNICLWLTHLNIRCYLPYALAVARLELTPSLLSSQMLSHLPSLILHWQILQSYDSNCNESQRGRSGSSWVKSSESNWPSRLWRITWRFSAQNGSFLHVIIIICIYIYKSSCLGRFCGSVVYICSGYVMCRRVRIPLLHFFKNSLVRLG